MSKQRCQVFTAADIKAQTYIHKKLKNKTLECNKSRLQMHNDR